LWVASARYEDLTVLKETNKVAYFVWVQAEGVIVLQPLEIEEGSVDTMGTVVFSHAQESARSSGSVGS